MSWSKKRSHYPTWEGLPCVHAFVQFHSTRNPWSPFVPFLSGLSFVVVGCLLFGLVGWFWCSIILAKKQLSKDKQSQGTKIPASYLNSHCLCFPELQQCLYLLLKDLHFTVMKIDPAQVCLIHGKMNNLPTHRHSKRAHLNPSQWVPKHMLMQHWLSGMG